MFNPVDFTNKRCLITGAASGIGRATAVYLSNLGADLLLLDKNKEQLEVTKTLCLAQSNISSVEVDLTDIEDMKLKISKDVEKKGKLIGMAHIAGLPYISPLKMLSKEKTLEVFLINTLAGIELAKWFANRKYHYEPSSIVFISSVYGLVGSAATVGYSISKGAIQSATKSLAIELAIKNIRVNCIAPGFIRTEMGESINHNFDEYHNDLISSLHPLGIGAPQDIAAGIAFLFSDMSKWITGTILSIDGGFTAQ